MSSLLFPHSPVLKHFLLIWFNPHISGWSGLSRLWNVLICITRDLRFSKCLLNQGWTALPKRISVMSHSIHSQRQWLDPLLLELPNAWTILFTRHKFSKLENIEAFNKICSTVISSLILKEPISSFFLWCSFSNIFYVSVSFLD